jgi:hypothetical protein
MVESEAEATEELIEFFVDFCSDRLRSIIQYDDEDYEILYGRADAFAPDSETEMRAFVDDFRQIERQERQRMAMYSMGSHHATVRVYDEAVVIYFLQGDDIGTVVSVDPSLASQLNTFIAQSLEVIYDTDQEVPNAPDWV